MDIFVVILIILGALALIFAAFLFMIAPNKKRDLSALTSNIYAHRGLHTSNRILPENSLPAFAAAKKYGCGVELDVRLTQDKKLLVFHDDNFKRMCGNPRAVAGTPYSIISELRLLSSDYAPPLLEDVLRVLNGTPVICEIKVPNSHRFDTAVCEKVCELIDSYPGDVFIESFNPFVLQWFKKNRPEIIRGQLSMYFTKKNSELPFFARFAARSLLTNFLTRPDFIAYRYSDDKTPAFSLCRKIFSPVCVAWTVKSARAAEYSKRSFSTVIFEGFLPK